MRPAVLPCVVFPALIATAVAQSPKWQLPDRGGALYARDLAVKQKIVPEIDGTPAVWRGEQPAGIVLAGEFDVGNVRRAGAVRDIRELVAQLGLDMGTGKAGKARMELATCELFQPVRIEASFGALADDGTQTFTATLEFDAKAARVEGASPPNAPKLTGHVQGTRTIDRQKGLVVHIDGSAQLDFDFPPHQDGDRARPAQHETVSITDVWKDPVVMAADSPEFKTRVVEAIRSSIDFLRKALQKRNDTPFVEGGDPYHDIQPGELALLLLALRHGGEDAHDAVLARGYESLSKRIIEGTYSLAVAILAVEALYTPPNEWAEMHAGRLKAPMARVLPDKDLALVRGWAKSLLGNIDTSVDAAYLRRWHYGPATSYDNSNTQYALLGLYGAQLCGVEVSPQVWTAAANHWLNCSIVTGAPEAADLLFQKDLEKGNRTRSGGSRVPPRGWGYTTDNATGSMTAAGITGLTLCSAGLRQMKKGNPKLLGEMDESVRGGLLWLQHAFTVRGNPGEVSAWGDWHLYYLYGLERACEFNQVARLGGRDWYFEGAMQLLATQRPDGSWGDWHDTSFGLLFLKKAALPALTGR